MNRIFIVTDLGPGDGGKGSIIHALSHKVAADVILKRGGAQGSHSVHTSGGQSFKFSQWGCGTLNGIPTHLTPQMVILPVGLGNEASALKALGIPQPFELISCDPDCIVAAPYHQIASEITELLMRDNPRGTVGSGVGQAYRLNVSHPELTIRARDLKSRDVIAAKLQNQAEYYRTLYLNVSGDAVLPNDLYLLRDARDALYDRDYLPYIIELFANIGKKLRLVRLEKVLRSHGTAVVECSHGVLTDAETGLKPNVSALRTLPRFPEEMVRNAGFRGEVTHLAVHRAYAYRHGAGPLPTYDPAFTARLFPDPDTNRWQGSIRAGKLDKELISHALKSCKGTDFAGLCLTCYDQTHSLVGACEAAERLSQSFFNMPLAILSYGPTERDKIFAKLF